MKKYLLLLFTLLIFESVTLAQPVESLQPTATKFNTVVFGTMLEKYGLEVNKDGEFYGFLADVLTDLSNRVGFDYTLKVVEGPPQLLEGVSTGVFDGVLSYATITAERETNFVDFSFPFLTSGISILISDPEDSLFVIIWQVLSNIKIWLTLLSFLGVILIWGWFSTWIFSHINHKKWFKDRQLSLHLAPLFFKAVWFSMVKNSPQSLSSQSIENAHFLSRIILMPLWVLGLVMTSIIIGQISSEMTLNSLKNNVNNIYELRNHPVGTIAGSTSQSYLTKEGFRYVKTFSTIEELYTASQNQTIRAVVYDHTVLLILQKESQNSNVPLNFFAKNLKEEFVGIPFNPDFRAKNEHLFSQINLSIIRMHNDGTLKTLIQKWYGNR